MCGIAGILDLNGSREINRDALNRMAAALVHRGPDGDGVFSAPGIGLAHQRLAIIDIAGGAQPFKAQARDCVLSFNGEIYNYQELAHELASKGLIPRTRSDTEILAEGLARTGTDFIDQLRGMFALSFWEPDKRRLTLARDRLGERPLYYAQTRDGFLLFASEIRAILASGMIKNPRLDQEAIADYFFYGYVPDPKTIYQDIHKLPPAHILTAGPGLDVKIKRYWQPVFAVNGSLNFSDAADLLRDQIDNAVSAQMISDAPLGAFLSGGADSAGVVASMHQSRDSIVACTIGFDEASHDERNYARQIASKFGAEHHELVAELDAIALIDDVAIAFGEPFADSSALPSYLLAKLARNHVTVALTGDGGDELFAGYRRYPFFSQRGKSTKCCPPCHSQNLIRSCRCHLPKARSGTTSTTV